MDAMDLVLGSLVLQPVTDGGPFEQNPPTRFYVMLTQLEHALTHQVSDRALSVIDASGQIVEGEILQFWVLVNQRTDAVVRDALSVVFEWRRRKLRPPLCL